MLDKKFIKQRKNQLLKEKKRIEKELKEVAKKKKDSQKYEAIFVDIGDKKDESATEVTLYSEYITLKEELEKNLAAINNALNKIEQGTYGICEICGKEIETKRLEAFPEATLCIKCKEKKEKGLIRQ